MDLGTALFIVALLLMVAMHTRGHKHGGGHGTAAGGHAGHGGCHGGHGGHGGHGDPDYSDRRETDSPDAPTTRPDPTADPAERAAPEHVDHAHV